MFNHRFNTEAGGIFSLELKGKPKNYNYVVIGKAGTGKVIAASRLSTPKMQEKNNLSVDDLLILVI